MNELHLSKRLSDVAQSLLWLDGKPFSLKDYPMYTAIYDGRFKSTLLMCGRQVAKSTSLANFIISESIALPFFKEYYLSPSKEQTLIFSNTRVGKTLSYSPLIRKYFQSPEHADRVLHRSYTNGSENAFTYACDDADRARGFSADRVCYDADAQALTRTGWKRVQDIDYCDELADVNDQGAVEWSRPTELIRKRHTGDMVTFQHRGFRLRVTGDHKMWVNYCVKPGDARYKQEDRYEFVRASDLAASERMGFKMTGVAAWTGQAPEDRSFEGLPGCYKQHRQRLTVPYAPFARFVGWYLAEGSLAYRKWKGERRQACPVLAQNVSRGLEDIEATLRACGLSYSVQHTRTLEGRSVRVNSPVIGAYLQPLGTSFQKYIPREFFEDPRLLKELLQGLYLGDASYHAGEDWDTGTLRTRSKRLAEDVQEAWLRLGRVATVYTRDMAGKPIYEIRPCKLNDMIFWRADHETKKRLTVEQVTDEEVYCFTIKNHRPIVKGGFSSKPVIGSNCYDEFQDMLYDAVVPVVNACMKNSKFRFETYAGTPKTMEASIQYLWDKSTQSEWIMKCSGCSKYNCVITEKSLGKHGPICLNCGKVLNPREGFWVDMRRQPEGEPALTKGFHVPQPIMPANIPSCYDDPQEQADAQDRWDDILRDMSLYSAAKFRNEVLGVSDAIGRRLISLEELQALCTAAPLKAVPDLAHTTGASFTVGGVDWSGGGTSGVSRTVLWVWGWVPATQQLRCMYYKVFPGNNAVADVREIAQTLSAYNVTMVVGDAGEGALPNSMLRDLLGHHRVTAVQYGAQSKPAQWNGLDRYLVDRTTMIDNYLMFLKRKGAEYATYEEMRPAINDILNVYEEVTTAGRKVWRHSPQLPDDCLHAQLFAWFAWKMVLNDLKFYT